MPKPFGIILKVQWRFFEKFLQLPKEKKGAFIIYDSPPELLETNDIIFFRTSYKNRGIWSYSRFEGCEDVDGYLGFGALKRGERLKVREGVKELLESQPIERAAEEIRKNISPYIADRILRADKALEEFINKYGRPDSEVWTRDREKKEEWTLTKLMELGDGPRGNIIFDYIREMVSAGGKRAVMYEEYFYRLFSVDPAPPGMGYRYLTLRQVEKMKRWFEEEKGVKFDFKIVGNKVCWM